MSAPAVAIEPTLGLYLSIPFCKAKCTFCNFASDVFAPHRLDPYVARLQAEIRSAPSLPRLTGADLPHTVDTLYFGGGTPSLLSAAHLTTIFEALRDTFHLTPDAEITVEAAPGQIPDPTLDELLRGGVNRISLGIQSFVDRETAAVGRLHTRDTCLAEITRIQRRGLDDLSLDLIAGLPHQTEASWRLSLDTAIATGAPHLSIYMLEVDDSSRLGHELLTAGTRYHAPTVPSDDDSARFYEIACETLAAAGLFQYGISNFARPRHHSRHNLKYWRRDPYLGFGLDAHSMLQTPSGAVRFANPADLDAYLDPIPIATPAPFLQLGAAPVCSGSAALDLDLIDIEAALEESLFLGLRLNAGISLDALRSSFGATVVSRVHPALTETLDFGLLEQHGDRLRLTPRGRMLSNEVFSRLLLPPAA